MEYIRFADLFCGIGGLRLAVENICRERNIAGECVLSSDIDPDAQSIYEANFGEKPLGDICRIETPFVPDHELLLAGFPCQPFSIIGERKGFEDTRGTLFFEIARILNEKRPSAFLLENVKQLTSHDQGKTLRRIMEALKDLGYFAQYKVLNALDFGLPQKRERVFIVGFLEPLVFSWPTTKFLMQPLEKVLEKEVSAFYYASDKIRSSRLSKRERIEGKRTIWHENKGGSITPHPYSCALRAGASYNYLLVDGERRLTEREMLRLQGFPETFKITASYQAMRKVTGNSVAVPVVESVVRCVFDALERQQQAVFIMKQGTFFESRTLHQYKETCLEISKGEKQKYAV